MTVMGLIVLLIVAAVVGSLGQALAGYSAGGCLLSILVGFIGAYLGMWIAGQLGLPEVFVINIEGQPFPILWSILGSALFSGVLGLLARQRVLSA
jgi:uncharacterized membrane protein YeaQ/YmgE (transglycosylase-associated protein family)